MNLTPDFGEAHNTCGGIKHVLLDPNPSTTRPITISKQIKAVKYIL